MGGLSIDGEAPSDVRSVNTNERLRGGIKLGRKCGTCRLDCWRHRFGSRYSCDLCGHESCVNLVEPGDTVIVCQNGAFGGRMKENTNLTDAEFIFNAKVNKLGRGRFYFDSLLRRPTDIGTTYDRQVEEFRK